MKIKFHAAFEIEVLKVSNYQQERTHTTTRTEMAAIAAV